MSQLIDIEQITVGDRLRPVDADHVAVIAASIRERGRVLQPIAVTKTASGHWVLVAGAHRLAAAKQAGLTQIPAEVHENLNGLQARMIEIDENLLRHELNPLDRAVFLAERKRVYEELHPETKHGAQGGRGGKKNENATIAFSKDAADRTGLGQRTIETAVKIANGLSPEIRARLTGIELSKNQKELLLLAKQEPDRQAQIVNLMMGENTNVKSVKAAIAHAGGKIEPVTDRQVAQQRSLVNAWLHAGIPARRAFVSELSEADRLMLRDLLNMAEPDIEEAA